MPRAAPARSAGSSWDETKHGAMLCPGWGISIIPAELKGSSLRRSLESAQYTSIEFGQRCREAGVRPSMGSVGDAYDNAMCESFFATLESATRLQCPLARLSPPRLPSAAYSAKACSAASPDRDRIAVTREIRAGQRQGSGRTASARTWSGCFAPVCPERRQN
jgi:hypothetical protein